MSASKKSKMNRFVQYGVVGAALGLYYGIFYKPVGDPDIGITFVLSIFAALFTVAVRSWKKGFTLKKMLKDFIMIFVFYQLFLLTLAIRQFAYDFGGKTLVIVTTTVSGVVLGLLMAWQRFGTKEIK